MEPILGLAGKTHTHCHLRTITTPNHTCGCLVSCGRFAPWVGACQQRRQSRRWFWPSDRLDVWGPAAVSDSRPAWCIRCLPLRTYQHSRDAGHDSAHERRQREQLTWKINLCSSGVDAGSGGLCAGRRSCCVPGFLRLTGSQLGGWWGVDWGQNSLTRLAEHKPAESKSFYKTTSICMWCCMYVMLSSFQYFLNPSFYVSRYWERSNRLMVKKMEGARV